MPKTNINKSVFLICQKRLDVELRKHGYMSHPAYQAGWEAAHQEYECNWLNQDLSSGLEEVSLTWEPSRRCIRVSKRIVHPPLDEGSTIYDLPTDPFIFSDYWIDYPYIRYTLRPRPRRFWQFRKMDLRFKPKDIDSPKRVERILGKHIIPLMPIFFQVGKELNRHRLIISDRFEIKNKS